MHAFNRWCIPSNSGWKLVSFEALVCHDDGNIEFSIEFSCKSWNSESSPECAKPFFQTEVASVLIPVAACTDLLRKFDCWMQDFQPFVSVLAATAIQGLDLEIGMRDDLITSAEKPAVTICYARNGCRIEVFYVIDQSCIEQSRTELSRVLAAFQNS